MSRVVGITGGIGTGKSTVAQIFADLGAQVASADAIAHKLLAKGGEAYEDVVRRFGDEILDNNGEIDRARLAAIVFLDKIGRKDLEEITHPHIIAALKSLAENFRKNPPEVDAVLVLEIPLLFEAGLENIVDEVLLVAAEQETRLNRLLTIRGMSRDQALARLCAQMPLDEKVKLSDRVIWNDGDFDSLRRAVKSIWDEIRLL